MNFQPGQLCVITAEKTTLFRDGKFYPSLPAGTVVTVVAWPLTGKLPKWATGGRGSWCEILSPDGSIYSFWPAKTLAPLETT